MQEDTEKRQALEAFVLNNPELEELEALLQEFNLFEVIGAIKQELRHSNLLALLLNPRENHGLGDTFVKDLLQRAVTEATVDGLAMTPLEIVLLDLTTIEVRREWRNIDILLLDETNRLVVIIENKIKSGEHSNQLKRYWQITGSAFPSCRKIGLFLTPEGYEPSDERYLPIGYDLIHDLLEELLEKRASTVGPDVRIAISHYIQALRRHIMPESDIAKLCLSIYRKHQRALDLIYEHRPDLQEEIRTLVEELVKEDSKLIPDHMTKFYMRFIPRSWDSPILKQGDGWTSSGRILLFEVVNEPKRLHLKVIIGPGPPEIRERLYQVAQENRPFRTFRTLGVAHSTIYTFDLLTDTDYEGAIFSELEDKIRERWRQFMTQILPLLTEVIEGQTWLWPEQQTNDPSN